MTSSIYPGGLDSLNNPDPTDTLDDVTVPHATQHTNVNDAVEAIEATLGLSPAGTAVSVVSRLDGADSRLLTLATDKAPLASPTFTGTVVLPSTTSIGNVSATEIGYLDGVTSALQTQLAAKEPLGTVMVKPIAGKPYPRPAGDTANAGGPSTRDQLLAYYLPVPYPVTISDIGVIINAGQASTTIRLGIYANGTDSKPGALIVDAGTIDSSGTGLKTITLGTPATLPVGGVWFAWVVQGAATSTLRYKAYAAGGGSHGYPFTLPGGTSYDVTPTAVWYKDSVTGTLPDPFGTTATNPGTAAPILPYLIVGSLL